MKLACISSHRMTIGVIFYYIQKLHLLQMFHPANGFLDLPTAAIAIPMPAMTASKIACSSMVTSSTSDEKDMPLRRSLRRKIPYVESFEEQIARELWEKNPFQGTNHVVDTIIGSGRDSDDCDRNTEFQPILTPIRSEILEASPSVFPHLSGYEDSFDLLYQRTNVDDIDSLEDDFHANANRSMTGIIGTASIVTSPFVIIVDNNETRKEKLTHFCMRVAYRGDDFCGWQTQLNNFEKPSVQRTLEEWLTELQNDQPLDAEMNAETKRKRRMEKREEKGTSAATSTTLSATAITDNGPEAKTKSKTKNGKTQKNLRIKWADLPVAGRTDAGVSAIGQLCRFRTYRKDLTAEGIREYLNDRVKSISSSGISRSLRVTDITRVSKAFHPTFTTSCRAYAYLIDIGSSSGSGISSSTLSLPSIFDLLAEERAEQQVALLDGMLRKIEGKPLDYIGLSYGKVKTLSTICTLYHARARLVEYTCTNQHYRSSLTTANNTDAQHAPQTRKRKAVCIELVGDRFLRRMVRLLVEASVRLVAIADAQQTKPSKTGNSKKNTTEEDALQQLIERQDRTLVGRPAPPDGLLFVGARVQSE